HSGADMGFTWGLGGVSGALECGILRGIMKRTEQSADGFALVITLAMLAVITLVTVSLSGLLRAKSESIRVVHDSVGARHNALLGLESALQSLQMLTGKDNVITARGDVLQEGLPDRQYYTWFREFTEGLGGDVEIQR